MMMCTGFTRARKAKIAISWYFFVEGAIMGNWAGVLPAVKEEQDLDNAELGAILVAAILGAMISLPVVSELTKRYGSGWSLLIGAVLTLILYPIVGVRKHLPVFIVGVFLLGFGAGWADVAMNAQAVLCEKMTRLPTLGLFHCVYAVGGLVGALVAGAVIQQGLTVFQEVVLVSLVLSLPQILLSCWLFSYQEERLIGQSNVAMAHYEHLATNDKIDLSSSPDNPLLQNIPHDPVVLSPIQQPLLSEEDEEAIRESQGASSLWTGSEGSKATSRQSSQSDGNKVGIPGGSQTDWEEFDYRKHAEQGVDKYTLYLIAALCFLGYFGNGSIGDWSAIYLKEELNSNPLQSTLGYVGFSLFVAFGTFFSDIFVHRFGRKRMLQMAGIVAAVGLAIAVAAVSFSNHDDLALSIAILGFSICGMGISVVPPSVISIAGNNIVGMEPTDAIALVSSVGYVGIMVGPPLLGGLSAVMGGLRWSFIIDAALMLLITILAGMLKNVDRTNSTLSSHPHEEAAAIQ